MESVVRTRKCVSRKTPQTVDSIESFSDQIRKASDIMTFDEFDNCYDSKYKVVKQDLKNGKDLDNICSKKVLGKDINWFAWFAEA